MLRANSFAARVREHTYKMDKFPPMVISRGRLIPVTYLPPGNAAGCTFETPEFRERMRRHASNRRPHIVLGQGLVTTAAYGPMPQAE